MTTSSCIHPLPDSHLIEVDNPWATARISLFGGHIISFCPKHDEIERFYLSPMAVMDGSKPIRGGMPVCWPWFGAHRRGEAYPAHGFARTRLWRLAGSQDLDHGTELTLILDDTAGEGFNGECRLSLTLTIGRQLHVCLSTHNYGDVPCEIGAALHSYFSISDIGHTQLHGLSGRYLDKPRNFAAFDTPRHYDFSGETDRVHLTAAPEVVINDGLHRRKVQSDGHDSIVVWNPWDKLAQAMSDMPDDGYRTMLCVETALTQGYTLAPGHTHKLVQEID